MSGFINYNMNYRWQKSMKCAANSVIEVIAPSWLISSFKSPTRTQPSSVPSGATSYVNELWFIPFVRSRNKDRLLHGPDRHDATGQMINDVERSLQQCQHSYQCDIILPQDERFVQCHQEYPSRMLISLETLTAFRMILIGWISYQILTNVTKIFLNTSLTNVIKIVFSWCCGTLNGFHYHSFVKRLCKAGFLNGEKYENCSWAKEFQNHILLYQNSRRN